MADMQNAKQAKVIQLMNKIKSFRKKVDEQTKGTRLRKMRAQTEKYSLKMNNFKRKKSVKQEEKGLTKRISYDLMCLKPPGK